MMEIERLIEQLYKHHEDYGQGKAQSLFNLSCDCKQAADALEQLQAENDRLRKERDAAVEDLNAITGDIEEIRRCNKFKWRGPKEE